ncbi:MAG: hypothetical protein OXI88_10185 [Gammaproteobacteria bacterium]|nr:hypothetical protein [Gammaproteobacteria bacterium]MDE0512138.1 hypothetical protein [Gammaproteobacteria bacterium]
MASYKSSQERVYRQLLSGLSDVIDNLEFEPFRLRVTGTAGSGKTQVTLPGFVTYNETSNFRTPTSIAGFIKQSLGQESRQRNMLPGLGVRMFEYNRKNQLEGKLAYRILTDLDETLEVDERTRSILYCAMTRATVLLELIVEQTCPRLDVFSKSI